MTKIEFLKKLFKTEDVKSSDCGQCYWVKNHHLVWVDTLKGGRVSIKLKYFHNYAAAELAARWMWDSLYHMPESVIDAKSGWDVYKGYCARFPGGYVARLRCDKHW